MSQIDDILTELKSLVDDGAKLGAKSHKSGVELRIEYESWYTRALSALQQLVPERVDEFRQAYRRTQRKQIDFETYAIDDYLHGMAAVEHVTAFGAEALFDAQQAFESKFIAQIGIVGAAVALAPSKLRDIRSILQAEILDTDVWTAGELLKSGHIRSAGVICGVAIESHLKSVAARKSVVVPKKATLRDLNQLMKDSEVYDVPMWRFVQRLADIRNLCGHKADREPTREEVDDLVRGTDKVLKEVA
jgi:hypothetical protein